MVSSFSSNMQCGWAGRSLPLPIIIFLIKKVDLKKFSWIFKNFYKFEIFLWNKGINASNKNAVIFSSLLGSLMQTVHVLWTCPNWKSSFLWSIMQNPFMPKWKNNIKVCINWNVTNNSLVLTIVSLVEGRHCSGLTAKMTHFTPVLL